MREHTFDAFTRRATVAVTRRGSLLALGGAALATGLGSSTGWAAKNNKAKKAKKAKKKAQKVKKQFENTCNQQKAQCQSILLAAGAPQGLICCNSCFSGDFVACLVSLLA